MAKASTHSFYGSLSFDLQSGCRAIAWGIVVIFIFLLSNPLFTQTNPPTNSAGSIGTPFMRNYPPDEYGAHNQNWAIVQDHRGFMYFGNNHGVLEYDGVSWRIIQSQNNNTIRSLAVDKNNRIFVGGLGEIGYLSPDSLQQLHYVSLLPQLDTSNHNFTDVWQTLATSAGIFFVTPKYVFRWNGTTMHVWNAVAGFHVGYVVNDQFYVRERSKGLMMVTGDDIVIAPLGETFTEERIMSMLPFPSRGEKAMLLTTRTSGMLIYDGITITPFTTEVDQLLSENQVYCGTKLTNGHYAFGTLQSGIVIIDESGKLRHHINKSKGLQDETIWYLYPDAQGSLWAGMHLGISRIETGSPHTYFGEREGLEGSVLQILRRQDILYAATSMGIYYLDESTSTPGRVATFRRVANVAPQGWALLPFRSSVLAGTFEGAYEINGGTGRVIDSVYAMSFARSMTDTNRVYIGLYDGFKSIYFNNGKWRNEGRVEGISDEILWIHAQRNGTCWLTTRNVSLLKVDYSAGSNAAPTITRFDTIHGLPNGDRTIAFSTTKGLRFGTTRGVYQLDKQQQRFYPDTTIIKGFSQRDIYSVTPDQKGNLWMISADQSGVAWLQEDDTYVWDGKPFRRINAIDDYYAYPDQLHEQLSWLGCVDRAVRYDRDVINNSDRSFKTYIRRISINEDSVLYGGADILTDRTFILHAADRSIRFSFAAPVFDEPTRTVFQHMLSGYDAQWSAWSTETYKDYTGLPNGEYKFLVRAKNIYGVIGETAIVEFRILPPFYLTSTAFLIYALLLIGLVYALWKIQLQRIHKTHTRELKEMEYVKLKELDQLKSRFFADISHEFRTPLTLIIGPVDNLLNRNPSGEDARQFHMIRRNAQRLLRLINQLLDLSKLDSGKMKLDLEVKDIVPMLKGIVPAFDSLAESKHVLLSLHLAIDHAYVEFDQDKMEQVISNLISNAIKFTRTGGQVNIHVAKSDAPESIEINVTDTGSGISENQLPFVFDRFYQGEEASRIDEPGTGIGLALAKELIELHKGRISVSSTVNKGSTFTVRLPLRQEMSKMAAPANGKESGRIFRFEELAADYSGTSIDEQVHVFENTLLLVEDNPDMRTFIRETLSGNYRILEAVDGEQGIEKATEYIPDIIISDVMMPRKDGLELCQRLKSDERTSHIPIVLLTAKADIDSKLAGLRRGADDYLAKPFHKEELLVRVDNLLNQRKQLWDRYAGLPQASSIHELAQPDTEDIRIEDVFLQKIRELIDQHLSDSDFEIDTLSRLAAMSRSQLFRKIKALTGKSPSLFIRNIRLSKAKDLLENTDMNVTEVAYQVGFSTPAYFSDAFTEAYGFRPSAVKK